MNGPPAQYQKPRQHTGNLWHRRHHIAAPTTPFKIKISYVALRMNNMVGTSTPYAAGG
jgi:hypothetical protein